MNSTSSRGNSPADAAESLIVAIAAFANWCLVRTYVLLALGIVVLFVVPALGFAWDRVTSTEWRG